MQTQYRQETQSRPIQKRCPTCKKTDLTDFSTCRYCGKRYDQQPRASNYNSGAVDPFKVFLGIFVVGSLVAVPYLYSQGFGSLATTHRYGYYGGTSRPSLLAIPLAISVFAGKHVYDDAENTIEKENAAIAVHGSNYDDLIKRADAYWTQLKTPQAIADYTAALSLRPRSREAYEKRAIAYDAMGNYDLAKQDRTAAADLH